MYNNVRNVKMITAKMYCVFLLSTLRLTSSANLDGYKSYENYKIYEVSGHREAVDNFIDSIEAVDDSVVFTGNRTVKQILLAPRLVTVFKDLVHKERLNAKLIFDDYSQVIQLEKSSSLRSDDFSWDAYYDIDKIYNYLRNVSTTYPQWAQSVVGGESYEGRKIMGLRINTPDLDEAKPVIFIESGIHAREWITPATITYFIDQLMNSKDNNIVALRNSFDWHIFPSVNPDGYHFSYTTDRMWRKTRSKSPNGCHGADPNRNWDYNWMKHGASNNPCDYQTYGGQKPFSEKETKTLSSYIAGLENLLAYIAFHSDAQMLLLPYSDSREHIDNYDDLVKIGETSLTYGERVNREKYGGPATAAEILYKVSGGSMDWVRNKLNVPLVYTYELRGFRFHWPPHLIYQQGDEVTQMLLGFSVEARNRGYY